MEAVKSERERGSRRRHRDEDVVAAAAVVVVKQERLSPEAAPPAHRRPDFSGGSSSPLAGEPGRPGHRGNRARGVSRSPAKKKNKSSGRRSKSPRSKRSRSPHHSTVKVNAYLLGRHRRIADIPIDHPSCSKQHAVFQYRLVEYTRADGTVGRRVKPYIIDLGSGNGTFLNNKRIEPQRYYELKEKDVLKFGFSSREYVLLHESSDTSEIDRKEDEDDEEEEEVSDS
ncbi:PREDICTED: smad nuclear-interacting protein 1 [Propithecus coquereli]|uniref:smad nuclear-interacting protein 1 n=1 Tax=Propithecus coquereli TaxID=379532 RepID=UPI00063F1CB1|nr:PREDICTED: smad nuclear-interacting protein 1 [Propithecus coquereli]